jgi:autotransporter passenger strand-loop-strand repeat protein
VISNGGEIFVDGQGVASGATVKGNGYLVLLSGGSSYAATINNGGIEIAESGGYASGSVVESGGYIIALPGSEVTNTISSGGVVVSTGVVEINLGSASASYPGSSATGETVVAGGVQYVLSGGTATSTTLSGTGASSTSALAAEAIVFSGGVMTSTTVSSGGIVYVSSGGSANLTTIDSGGIEIVAAGGVAANTTVSNGGFLIALPGSTASSTGAGVIDINLSLGKGAYEGRTDTSNTVSAGYIEYVLSGGSTVSATVSGSIQYVFSGGSVTATGVSADGSETVFSGGSVVSSTIYGEGSETLQAGASATGFIGFDGGGAGLTIDGTTLPSTVISGFDYLGSYENDSIVLAGFAYATSDTATLESGNTLVLSLGGLMETLYFDATQNFAGEVFVLSGNSSGQVVITDPLRSAVDDPPTILGAVAGQAISDEGSTKPFSGITIVDGNAGATESLTITLSSAANGRLSNLAGGTYNAVTGVYAISGSANAVSEAIDGLVFTPTGQQVAPGETVTTTFTIQDTDSAGVTTTNTTTSVVATAAVGAGTIFRVTGADTVATLLNNGTVVIGSHDSLDITSAVDPDSTGIFDLTNKGSLVIASLLGTDVKIAFLGTTPGDRLTITNPADFGLNVGSSSYEGPLLEDFKVGDVIDLKGVSSTGLKLNYNPATGDLQVTSSSGGVAASLQFQESSLGSGTFHTASDKAGGTFLTLT